MQAAPPRSRSDPIGVDGGAVAARRARPADERSQMRTHVAAIEHDVAAITGPRRRPAEAAQPSTAEAAIRRLRDRTSRRDVLRESERVMLTPKRVKWRKQHRGRMRGKRAGRQHADLRRLRFAGARAVLDDQPPDRSRPYRDDPPHQARRKSLDQGLSRQAGDEEAGRSPHGFRQGQSRVLGRRRASRAACSSRSPASSETVAREALRLASAKLPIAVKFVSRSGETEAACMKRIELARPARA